MHEVKEDYPVNAIFLSVVERHAIERRIAPENLGISVERINNQSAICSHNLESAECAAFPTLSDLWVGGRIIFLPPKKVKGMIVAFDKLVDGGCDIASIYTMDDWVKLNLRSVIVHATIIPK